MAMRIVRLGTPRRPREGLRIGTVRRPPRGIKKEDYASMNIYDVWFPNLAPSEVLLKEFFPIKDDQNWRIFRRRFVAEMKAPTAKRDIELLATLSHRTDFSIGCYCEMLVHRNDAVSVDSRTGRWEPQAVHRRVALNHGG